MSDIQRYRVGPDYLVPAHEDDNGPWVTYADHVAAVAAAEERVTSDFAKYLRHMDAYDKGYAAGVKAARETVAAHIRADLTGQEMFCGRKRGILAAIDALTTRDEGRNTG